MINILCIITLVLTHCSMFVAGAIYGMLLYDSTPEKREMIKRLLWREYWKNE